MNDLIERIDKLDISLFDGIRSYTAPGDRRSLLAVQRAIARKHKEYVYLEIGSHLGGSLQPYLADARCKRIYSIDPRPSQQPDDRSLGFTDYYKENSTERMLNMLRGVGYGDVEKIECFALDASEVDPSRIITSPQIAFIDGEHTNRAVISDFQFCAKVIRDDGVILFHDFDIIYPAIIEICHQLSKQSRAHLPMRLEGNVFAICLDPSVVTSDPYLASMYNGHKHFWLAFRVKTWLKKMIT